MIPKDLMLLSKHLTCLWLDGLERFANMSLVDESIEEIIRLLKLPYNIKVSRFSFPSSNYIFFHQQKDHLAMRKSVM
jgi:hypothetical protein